MNCLVRVETPKDYSRVREVTISAFYQEGKDKNFNEWVLIEKIRGTSSYIRELSLVAEVENIVQGHIIFTPLKIKSKENTFDSLALAPVSVHKDYQNQGIGKLLVNKGIEMAQKLGYSSIIVMGHPTYYPQFGFELASKWSIGIDNTLDNNCLFALELFDDALSNVSGNIEYCSQFYNERGELI